MSAGGGGQFCANCLLIAGKTRETAVQCAEARAAYSPRLGLKTVGFFQWAVDWMPVRRSASAWHHVLTAASAGMVRFELAAVEFCAQR